MGIVLDHTIVPVRDREASAAFYNRIFGFVDEGEVGPFRALRVTDSFTLDFRQSDETPMHHYAFAMDPEEFDAAFVRIRNAGITYGDGPMSNDNMQGPGITAGARGPGKAVYFKDPDGHILEIKTYPA